MKTEKVKTLESVNIPDFILKVDLSELLAIKFYDKTPLTSKYLIVVYKEPSNIDGFIHTAYFTNRIAKWREILWRP